MTAERITSKGKSTKRVVTFATSHTSILIPAANQVSPLRARERTRALRTRKATPRKRGPLQDINDATISSSSSSSSSISSPSPAMKRLNGEKPRLIESGAVRVQIDRCKNPRRGDAAARNARYYINHKQERLVDQGAVRVNITRHTTPRRLYATRKRIWSPPPPSSSKRRKPQSEIAYRKVPSARRISIRVASTATPSKKRRSMLPQSERVHRNPPMVGRSTTTTFAATPTPSKKRSNAHTGGHRFRSMFSPYYATPSTPAITEVLFEEENDEDDLCLELERGLSRTLFD
mmetsp:Transcript_10958/g.23216  ORF Transcript_10958/g.23216 Transcript_10958/m.23216 type:complete len:290 (+) Transcript_10958:227-1096(+)